MAYEQRPGDIVIFKNEGANESAPQYKGKGLDLDGNEIEIALWVKQGKTQKFFSGRIERPRQQSAGQRQPAKTNDPFPNYGQDQMPF